MVYWKEWRKLRARFLSLSAFYLITAAFIPIPNLGMRSSFMEVPLYLVSWGAALLLTPAILGMDTFVGERDEGTLAFFFSKPIPVTRMVMGKIGVRLLLTLAITVTVLGLLLVRFFVAEIPLYLATPPYVIWSVVGTIVAAQLAALGITVAVSLRAPYQSTALIIGSTLSAAVTAYAVIPRFWRIEALQDIWSSFWLLLLLTLVLVAVSGYYLTRPQLTEQAA